MDTVTLGSAGVDVSAMCFGTMYLGSRYDNELSFRLLDAYAEAGGAFLDTANIYSHRENGKFIGGESELLLGKWMAERKNRSNMFVATKMGFPYVDVERGLSARQIEEECHKSLKRLGVDTIDLFYTHVDDRNTPIEETMGALNRLVAQGKVRFIGASNTASWRLEEARCVCEAHSWAQYTCIQQRYSYLQPRAGSGFGAQLAADASLLDYCRHRPIRLLGYSPLLSGAYASRKEYPPQYCTSDNAARLKAVTDVAEQTGATGCQVVLAWMMQSDPSAIPIISASSISMLNENLAAMKIKLDQQQMQQLNQAGEENHIILGHTESGSPGSSG